MILKNNGRGGQKKPCRSCVNPSAPARLTGFRRRGVLPLPAVRNAIVYVGLARCNTVATFHWQQCPHVGGSWNSSKQPEITPRNNGVGLCGASSCVASSVRRKSLLYLKQRRIIIIFKVPHRRRHG